MVDIYDNNELSTIMNEYGKNVLNTAFLYLKDKQLAEDVFQEVFLKAYLKINTFEFRSSVKTWLIRITINQCKDAIKCAYKKKVDIGLKDFDCKSDSVETVVEDNLENERLYNTVLSLEPQYREIVLLRYYNDLSLDEISEILHISNGAVRTRLSRTTALLKRVMTE